MFPLLFHLFNAVFCLTAFEGRVIAPLFATKSRGVPRADERRVMNGIVRTLRSCLPWPEMPER